MKPSKLIEIDYFSFCVNKKRFYSVSLLDLNPAENLFEKYVAKYKVYNEYTISDMCITCQKQENY